MAGAIAKIGQRIGQQFEDGNARIVDVEIGPAPVAHRGERGAALIDQRRPVEDGVVWRPRADCRRSDHGGFVALGSVPSFSSSVSTWMAPELRSSVSRTFSA